MTLLIIVHQDDDFDKSLTVSIDDEAGKVLFDELRPLFEKTMADEEFWLEHYDTMYQEHNFMEFDDLPTEIFMQAYGLIQKSDNQDLKPFMPEILQKMQADPRFKKVA